MCRVDSAIHSVVVLETMVLVSSGLEAKSAGLGLGLAFKQDQDLINFVRSQPQSCDYYTLPRPTVPVST